MKFVKKLVNVVCERPLILVILLPLKSLLHTNVLNALFLVGFFTVGSWEKDTKNIASVTSLRTFVRSKDFIWKQIELLLQKKLHPIMDSSEQSQEFRSLSMGKRHIPAKIRLCRLHKYVFLVIHQKECKTRIFLSHLLSLYLAMLKSKDATIH